MSLPKQASIHSSLKPGKSDSPTYLAMWNNFNLKKSLIISKFSIILARLDYLPGPKTLHLLTYWSFPIPGAMTNLQALSYSIWLWKAQWDLKGSVFGKNFWILGCPSGLILVLRMTKPKFKQRNFNDGQLVNLLQVREEAHWDCAGSYQLFIVIMNIICWLKVTLKDHLDPKPLILCPTSGQVISRQGLC